MMMAPERSEHVVSNVTVQRDLLETGATLLVDTEDGEEFSLWLDPQRMAALVRILASGASEEDRK